MIILKKFIEKSQIKMRKIEMSSNFESESLHFVDKTTHTYKTKN